MQQDRTATGGKRRNPALTGIDVRHQAGCPAAPKGSTARCRCQPRYRGKVWDPARKQPLRGPWMATLAAARGWRSDAQRRVEHRRETGQTVEEGLRALLAAAEAGHVRNRSGERFKPRVLADYRAHSERRLIPRFGVVSLAAVTHADLNRYVAELLSEGLSPSTIRNVLMPLRALYREAVALGEVETNPTRGLRLPASRGRRERIATPEEAELLISGLEPQDQALWACAFYLGLRRGELMALRAEDVDLAAGLVRVHPERGSFDVTTRTFGAPKSRAGVRTLPIPRRLRPFLAALDGREGLLFARADGEPFDAVTVMGRARRAWGWRWDAKGKRWVKARPDALAPIGLHECRHTFASYLIAAGANAKAVQTMMGHSSITTTFDRYGHLFPGHEDEVRSLLDAHLG